MIIGTKIRLLPTKEQEVLFRKSCGISRWAYNYYLYKKKTQYKDYINGLTCIKNITGNDIRKEINKLKNCITYSWLKDVGCNVIKQAVIDAETIYNKFLKGLINKPHYKTKHKSLLSFYVNYETLRKTKDGFKGEKLGNVKTFNPLPKLKHSKHYSNPRISYDGKYWYLSVSYEIETLNSIQLSNEVIGIDLGIKELATLSNGKIYKNINKTKEIKRLNKKLKREQRKISRKILINKKVNKKLNDCKNFQKQKRKIKLIYRRITNIRTNYLHQTTTEIVKTKPSKIVMENLNVRGMMKNKHLSKAIAEQKFYEFCRQIEYKCKYYGIEFVLADRFYPSSKTCSNCGNIKKDLKLKDHIYKCPICGNIIDRDLNAAINLANYKKV